MPKRKIRQEQLHRISRSAAALRMRKKRANDRWESIYNDFNEYSDSIKNPKGKTRSFEENKMLLLGMKAALKRRLNCGEPTKISWTSIDIEMAEDFGYARRDVRAIRKQFFESEGADILINEVEEADETDGDGCRKRGHCINNNKQKIHLQHLHSILEYVDASHKKGQAVTVRKIRNHLRNDHHLSISRGQVHYTMKKLGLHYQPLKARRRNMNSFRPERIREYIIGYDKIKRKITSGEKWVFVFTDESYIHENHHTEKSYFINGKNIEINRSFSRGRRLIILHAITKDGPLAEIDPATNKPALGRLKWTGKTPHPIREDGDLLTCETLWPADTHTGDYHDNMRSDIFLKWVNERLIPTFKRVYPGQKMCLVLDNAPYHHKREIGSLQGVSKSKIIELMIEDAVKEIELPFTDSRWNYYQDGNDNDFFDRGETVEVSFDPTEQEERAGVNKPRVANVKELQFAYLKWIKVNKPQKLLCSFETRMNEEGYEILWTPPYCPKLQPIEMFWAAGKNHVANLYDSNTTMKDVIRRLQDGWYGNDHQIESTDNEYTKGVRCEPLIRKCEECANAEYIALCPGLQGQIGNLEIDETHDRDTTQIPIDSFVIDLTKGIDRNEETDDDDI